MSNIVRQINNLLKNKRLSSTFDNIVIVITFNTLKLLPLYFEAAAQRERPNSSHIALPVTPDHTDHAISKRAWDSQMRLWKEPLRRWAHEPTGQLAWSPKGGYESSVEFQDP